MHRIAYVYKLTDAVTGKWYIGSRTAKGCCPEELGVKYFTSSRVVKPLYKSEPARFKAEIMVQSEDSEYIVKVESSMLKLRNAKDDENSYNMHNGDGKMNTVKSGTLSMAKMKAENKGLYTPESIAKRKEISSKLAKELVERKLGAHSPETRAKISAIGKVAGADNIRLKRGIFSSTYDRSKRKEPWWYNPSTGVSKRSYISPGEEFKPGRGPLKKKES